MSKFVRNFFIGTIFTLILGGGKAFPDSISATSDFPLLAGSEDLFNSSPLPASSGFVAFDTATEASGGLFSDIPEPSSLTLLGFGALLTGVGLRRKSRSH